MGFCAEGNVQGASSLEKIGNITGPLGVGVVREADRIAVLAVVDIVLRVL